MSLPVSTFVRVFVAAPKGSGGSGSSGDLLISEEGGFNIVLEDGETLIQEG